MHKLVLVHGDDRLQHLTDDRPGFGLGQWFVEEPLKIAQLEILHGDEQGAFVLEPPK